MENNQVIHSFMLNDETHIRVLPSGYSDDHLEMLGKYVVVEENAHHEVKAYFASQYVVDKLLDNQMIIN